MRGNIPRGKFVDVVGDLIRWINRQVAPRLDLRAHPDWGCGFGVLGFSRV